MQKFANKKRLISKLRREDKNKKVKAKITQNYPKNNRIFKCVLSPPPIPVETTKPTLNKPKKKKQTKPNEC